jgi:hypothetical protein
MTWGRRLWAPRTASGLTAFDPDDGLIMVRHPRRRPYGGLILVKFVPQARPSAEKPEHPLHHSGRPAISRDPGIGLASPSPWQAAHRGGRLGAML